MCDKESFFSTNRGDRRIASMLSRRTVMFEKVAQESIENNCAKLRTLVVSDAEMKDAIPMLAANLQKLRRLRTLFLSLSGANTTVTRVESTKWLGGIGSLQHLVCLHLESIDDLRTLPDSIGNLRNLQILSIVECSNLESLPPSITMLEKLIAFTVLGCESIECLPKGLGKLSNLEQLICLKSDELDIAGYSISFAELKKLTKLRLLTLEISEEEQLGEEECNVLEMPESLQILWLGFSGFTPASAAGIARKIDRPLSHPLQSLKELYLGNLLGESTPAWLNPTSLPNLQHLSIIAGRIKKMGPRFLAEGGAWKVETLELASLNGLEDNWEIIERAMPFLRLASVTDCPKLKYSEEDFQPGPHNSKLWKKHKRGESSSSLQLLQ